MATQGVLDLGGQTGERDVRSGLDPGRPHGRAVVRPDGLQTGDRNSDQPLPEEVLDRQPLGTGGLPVDQHGGDRAHGLAALVAQLVVPSGQAPVQELAVGRAQPSQDLGIEVGCAGQLERA